MYKSNCKNATEICFEELFLIEKEDEGHWIKQMIFFHSEYLTQTEWSLDVNIGRLGRNIRTYSLQGREATFYAFSKDEKSCAEAGVGTLFPTGGIKLSCFSRIQKSFKLKIKWQVSKNWNTIWQGFARWSSVSLATSFRQSVADICVSREQRQRLWKKIGTQFKQMAEEWLGHLENVLSESENASFRKKVCWLKQCMLVHQRASFAHRWKKWLA